MKIVKTALFVAAASMVMIACQSSPAETKAAAPAAPAEEKPAVEKPVGNTADVKKGTPEIDAVMDDLYADAQVLKTEAVTEGDTDVYAEVRALWDEEYIYVFFDVKDPVLSSKNANEWEHDSVEVVIDQNNGKTKAYQGDDAQYRVNYKNQKSYGTGASTKLFKSATATTDTGYVVEMAVPLHKVPGAAGNLVGIDFQVNEDNGSGRRTAIRCWNDTTNTNYMSTANLGTITLVE